MFIFLLGVFYINKSGNSLLESSTLINCKSANLGGVVRYFVNSEVKWSNFDRCKTSDSNSNGGAIHVEACDLNISDSTFSGCRSMNGGGAISFFGKTLILKNTGFLFCESYDSSLNTSIGGAIRLCYSPSTFNNCSFLNCRSGLSGGAIGEVDETYEENISILLNNCYFLSNFAANGGGAIYIYWITITCVNCSFLHNSGLNSGGAMYCGDSFFTDTVFVRNYVDKCSTGGALFIILIGGTSSFNNCIFIKNRILRTGGSCNSFFFFFLFIYFFFLL
jgi:predicted outer membrane repeat protein